MKYPHDNGSLPAAYYLLPSAERTRLDNDFYSGRFTSAYHRDWEPEEPEEFVDLTVAEMEQPEHRMMICYCYIFDSDSHRWTCYDGNNYHDMTAKWLTQFH
ncbi:hypothetical protein [Secundilactobacillus kimchicus]|uniref:hypothetical protein n=1 Tax=Secundilactobacillus kimchicus TaxID=528209 RepID=UPI0024A8B766|nr:hypothetical protein [Secundilactobacillus kimchicus]